MTSSQLRNVRLPGHSEPVDLLISRGTIVEIRPTASDSPELRTSDTEVVQGDGRWVVPGLWDNHVHFTQWAISSRRLDVGSARSAAETAALVGAALSERSAAGPAEADLLVGVGFRDGLWPDLPTAALLDGVSGLTPVVLISGDLHCVWLNSAALRRFGHAEVESGILREGDAFPIAGAVQQASAEQLDAWAAEAAAAASRRGVVGIVDLEMEWNRDVWLRRFAAGFRNLRVEFGIYPQHLDRAIAEGLRSEKVLDGTDGLLAVGPLKIITDGSLNTRTAYCVDPYPGLSGPESRGLLTVDPRDLVELLATGTAAGFRSAVHAIGDAANTHALDAFAATGARGSIEHAQLLSRPDFARFAELDLIASVQPEHALDDRDVADRFWAGRTDRAFALGSLLAAGARLALGSDAPVAPLDPWVTIAAAVGRDRDGRAPWHPEQSISAADALVASARTRIAVGQAADLAILDVDPLSASSADLRSMPVAATLIGGRFTHTVLAHEGN